MNDSERSLRELIEQAAADAGVQPEDEFLVQVRRLFADKGIELSEDASPFAHAVLGAFQLHAQMRRTQAETQLKLDRLNATFQSLARTWQRLEAELARLRASLAAQEQSLRRRVVEPEGEATFQWPILWPSRVLN